MQPNRILQLFNLSRINIDIMSQPYVRRAYKEMIFRYKMYIQYSFRVG